MRCDHSSETGGKTAGKQVGIKIKPQKILERCVIFAIMRTVPKLSFSQRCTKERKPGCIGGK